MDSVDICFYLLKFTACVLRIMSHVMIHDAWSNQKLSWSSVWDPFCQLTLHNFRIAQKCPN